ncbi:threonine transporter RhtB [Pseudomonas sp. MPFS]|uniref:LysE family translocator n=1 Tax=Pseudomonas sp. MPFS TaxID=2795724 RepID=UPI001F131CF0|nr:threonine transporter RhtB [Pseudomonas sp. MPFS]UMZ10594.1 threonine transporter RhtB [Pseudomonas sp. MPFS]
MFGTISALVLLLIVPGPTNTLLMRSGALFGFAASWRMAFIEGVAYLFQVSVWGTMLFYISAWSPWVVGAMQIATACYLLQLSCTLWRRKSKSSSPNPNQDRLSGLHFFWLTVMNPKGLLIASIIAPISAFASLKEYTGFMSTLALVVIPVGSAWILLGSRLEGCQKTWLTPVKINRMASVAIGSFATILLIRLAGSDIS